MATRKKKRTPAQERATKRMIAARKKQLGRKKKPAKKKTAKKKTARKKSAVRQVRSNPAGRSSSGSRPMYFFQDNKSGGWWNGPGFVRRKNDRIGTRSLARAKAIANQLANKTGRSIAVIKE